MSWAGPTVRVVIVLWVDCRDEKLAPSRAVVVVD